MSLKYTLQAVNLDDVSPLLLGLINDGTDVKFTVTGNSMNPMVYHHRDSVILTKCDPLNLKKGQIPLYKRPGGQYVLHRIIKVNADSYNITGDRQTEIEYNVPKESVLCVVKGFYRKDKYHSCDEPFYRFYSSVWMFLRPVRIPILHIFSFFKNLFKDV